MNTPSFRNSTVRNSLIATTRPVSRRWKKLVTKIKALRKRDNYYDDDEDDEDVPDDDQVVVTTTTATTKKIPAITTATPTTETPTVIKRRHSSDELKRKVGFPYYTEEPAENERRTLDRPKRKDSASLSALHHISMPAGPVSSALSPPPRHTMTKRKLVDASPAPRPPVIVRLSIDLHERDEEGQQQQQLDEMHPFRSGTLGNINTNDGGYTIPTAPVPDIPLRERRKRRSPLSIPDDLTLSLKKKPSLHHQQSNTSMISSTASSVTTSTSSSAISVERNKAMNALEGLDRDKAQYDAVVGRRRTPVITPTTANSTTTTTTTGGATMIMSSSNHQHHYNEPTPSLTPSSRPLYYPSSPSSIGTVVEETAKFSIAPLPSTTTTMTTTASSQQPPPPLPSTRIPESLRHYRDL